MQIITATVYGCDTCGKRFFTTRAVHIHAHHIHGDPALADLESKAQKRKRLVPAE